MLNVIRIFHVLDSLPSDPRSTKEAMQLQKVLLKHFEGVDYLENRVSSNIPLVSSILSQLSLNSHKVKGTAPTKQQGLWLLHHPFRSEVFAPPIVNYSGAEGES